MIYPYTSTYTEEEQNATTTLATIVIEREEVVKHARDAVWLHAKSTASRSEKPELDDKWLIDIFEKTFQGDGSNELPTRMMTLAFSELSHMLREWTDDAVDAQVAYSDQYKEPDVYSIEINVTSDWHVSDINLLTQYIHYLIVYKVLTEWCILVCPELAQTYSTLESSMQEKLRALLVYSGCVSRKPFPFPFG